MAIIQFVQGPLGVTADLVVSTSTAMQELAQNPLATSISTGTSNWLTLPSITTTETSTYTPIQTLITSLLYREPSDTASALAKPTLVNAMSEPTTNVHSNFPEFGKLAVTPYQLMYIVAICVTFVILMSFCCCTDDVGRYMNSKRRTGATNRTTQARPTWPSALRFMDGANDTSISNRASRGDSTARSSMSRPTERSDSTSPSTLPRNPFTKITIKTCEEGHDSIIIDEIELRDLPSQSSRCDFSNNCPDFNHEYVTTNPQVHVRDGRVSLRGGSGTQGDLSDSFMRTGAITSFKETEERWKPTWSAAKSLFSTRRRQSEPILEEAIGLSISGVPNITPDHDYDRSHQKSSTTASKRALRQSNTSGTAFSFPLSDGSDSEIPRFPTINRIKKKLKPLIHSVSKQSLRDRFSTIDHSKDNGAGTEEADLDGLVYSNTVRKALRRARSSAPVPVGLFKLPDPARDDPAPSAAGPVSIMATQSAADDSDTDSQNTMRARSPVSTLLGVSANIRSETGSQKTLRASSSVSTTLLDRKSGPGSGSGRKSNGSRRVVVSLPAESRGSTADEIDRCAVMAFANMRSYEAKRDKEIQPKSLKTAIELESKDEDKDVFEYEDEDKGLIGDSKEDETKEESYVTCRSTNSSQEEHDGCITETEQEPADATPSSYMNSTRSGHVNRTRNRGQQTATTNHFHARRARAGTSSSETLVAAKRERMKGRLGLLMIRGVAGGDGRGLGARRGGKVELVTMDLGGDF